VSVNLAAGTPNTIAAGADPTCELFYGGIPVIDTAAVTDNTNNDVIGAYSRNWSVLA